MAKQLNRLCDFEHKLEVQYVEHKIEVQHLGLQQECSFVQALVTSQARWGMGMGWESLVTNSASRLSAFTNSELCLQVIKWKKKTLLRIELCPKKSGLL